MSRSLTRAHLSACVEALNIASARHRTSDGVFAASAAQIAEVLNSDEQLREVYALRMSAAQVAAAMRTLSAPRTATSASGERRVIGPALVRRAGGVKGAWQLTGAGCGWLQRCYVTPTVDYGLLADERGIARQAPPQRDEPDTALARLVRSLPAKLGW